MKWAWVLLTMVSAGCAAVQTVPLPLKAEQLRVATRDGWQLELVHYRAEGAQRGLPVVICHGISANARNMDLDDQHSLAQWLASQGRDTWSMSLRGTGASSRPDPAAGRAVPTFDDFWRFDLPAVIDTVLSRTNAQAVDYVGHSMGGMIMYAFLGEGGQGVHAIATLASPTRLDWGTALQGWLHSLGPLLSSQAVYPSGVGGALAAPFQPLLHDSPFERLLYNARNTRPEVWQRLMAYGTADTAGGVAIQLSRLVATGAFASADGSIDFRAHMARIATPALVVAGRVDRVAPAAAVRDGYEALSGPKEWLLVSRANGAAEEYGHMDLVIGEYAKDEVWPHVLDFFDRHASHERAVRTSPQR